MDRNYLLNKKIGILGGTSYPSTLLYYETLNRLYHKKFGEYHSCPIILYSIDYNAIKSNYHDGWSIIPKLLKKELEILASFKPSCIIIANNTLHKAYDIIKDTLETGIPVLHIIDLTKQYIEKMGYNNVLLLGTKFTMEDSFFKQPLSDGGVNIVIPNEEERFKIQEIQTQVSSGSFQDYHVDYFKNVINKKYAHLDAFILGCTEIPLIYKNIDTNINLINTLALQCEEAMFFFE
ncbi:aspartate/glutamate racemase family protein [Sphingobacterium gobiense]|uniref:Aspartate racemase n=1 Tax=Sphingobacterium gobiense TaxID=1382456 RepID=A0A2S9JTY2_9SPHI|nr:amino acid racemase [Sphingobacterium gobiense]PRD56729.1 aspartate racemase [Sphingobacterium gobiense]